MPNQNQCHVATAQLKYGDSIDACIANAAKQGAQLLVLPELHDHLYFCQVKDASLFKLATPIPGPVTRHYSRLAKKHAIVLVTSLFEQADKGNYYNTAVVFDSDGSMAGKYRKMHIPDGPNYWERFYFTPGNLGYVPASTSIGNIGVLVCWDQWFPEAARLMTLANADMLVYPTAIGWEPSDSQAEKQRQLDAWTIIQRSHAIANSLPVIACNRYGFEGNPGGIDFWGNSFICGPQGEILASTDHTNSVILHADIDFERTHAVREVWPYLPDRRTDSYDELCRKNRE